MCLGLPGSLPVLNEKAVEYALRVAEALHLKVPERSVFSRKNYFYPDMPKDYQTSQYDQPITIDGWLDVDGARDRHHARAPRGGHRQDAAHRWQRSHPRRRLLARRLQPRRRAAARDRLRARHPVRRAGEALRRRAARHAARDRRLRREDGRGLAARRRQRVGAAPGTDGVRHALRDQEPQLVAVVGARRSSTRRSGRSTAREFGDAHRAGDAPLGRSARAHDLRPFEGRGARLPLLPRARPRAGRADRRDARRRARDDARAPGGAARATHRGVGDQGGRRAGARRTSPVSSTTPRRQSRR